MKKLLKKVFSTETELKIEKFLVEQLWQLLLVTVFVFGCAWLFDKYAEAVMFSLAHTFIRMTFDKQYHFGKTYLCLFATCTIAFFGIAYCLPVAISLLSSVPVCFGIAWVGFVVQDRVDIKTKGEKNIFNITKSTLLAIMENSTLSNEEKDAIQYKVIDKMKGDRFYRAMGYSKRQSIRIYKSAIEKLNNLISQ